MIEEKQKIWAGEVRSEPLKRASARIKPGAMVKFASWAENITQSGAGNQMK
jgi:hypothetical protein